MTHHKNKHVYQWNKIKGSSMCNYSFFISDKEAKTHTGVKTTFSTNGTEKPGHPYAED